MWKRIFRTEGNRHNVLGIFDIINQAAAFALGHIFNSNDIGFVLTQGSNGSPLERDAVICQGERRSIRRKEQVDRRIRRRNRGGRRWPRGSARSQSGIISFIPKKTVSVLRLLYDLIASGGTL